MTGADRWMGGGQPLIDDADAALLKVGQSYRNDAYHEDAQNEFVISTIVRVVFAAVARLIAHMQRPAVAGGS